MDETTSAKILSPEEEILALAREHRVTYQSTEYDDLAEAMTRLAGDGVELDEPALLLLALRRAGHITAAEAARLHGAHLRAKYE